MHKISNVIQGQHTQFFWLAHLSCIEISHEILYRQLSWCYYIKRQKITILLCFYCEIIIYNQFRTKISLTKVIAIENQYFRSSRWYWVTFIFYRFSIYRVTKISSPHNDVIFVTIIFICVTVIVICVMKLFTKWGSEYIISNK